MELWKKLQWKDQSPILLFNCPADLYNLFAELNTDIKTSAIGKFQFIIVFAESLSQINKLIPIAVGSLESSGILWSAYPKKSSKKYKSDISRDCGWELFSKSNFEPVRQISINEDWTALRFKKVSDIKTMKRKTALSEKGKERISKNS